MEEGDTIFLVLESQNAHLSLGFPNAVLENYSNFHLSKAFLFSSHHFIKKIKLLRAYVIVQKSSFLFLFSSERGMKMSGHGVDTWCSKDGVAMHPSAHDPTVLGILYVIRCWESANKNGFC